LSEGLEIDISLLQGGNIGSKIASPSSNFVDILISTVNAASLLTTAGVYSTKHVQHVVLDEADTLLDDSFADDVTTFLRKFSVSFVQPNDCLNYFG
jgi:superfamily II DNA/RNA helicase